MISKIKLARVVDVVALIDEGKRKVTVYSTPRSARGWRGGSARKVAAVLSFARE
jgi:hypothetical protein